MGIFLGVFSNGLAPSWSRSTVPRFPGSAPGPPPLVRPASGLAQPATWNKQATTRTSMNFTLHLLGREDDHGSENETAHENQRGGGRDVAFAEQIPPPVKRQRQQHAADDDADDEQQAPGI